MFVNRQHHNMATSTFLRAKLSQNNGRVGLVTCVDVCKIMYCTSCAYAFLM